MAQTTLSVAQTTNINQAEYWDKRLLEMIKLETSNFVFSQLGREIEIPKNQGTTIMSVPRYNHLPVGNHQLSEGVAPTPLQPEGVKVQMTLAQYGAYMEITDWVADIHMHAIKSVYQPELSRQASEVKERNILTALADGSEYFVGAKTTVDGYAAADTDYLTLEDCRRVALFMKNYNRKGHRKFGGKFVVVSHTNVMNDLLDDDILTQKLLVPGNENTPIKTGTLAQYMAYGLNFVETLIAPKTLNANASPVNVYTSYVLGYDPYVITKLGKGGVQWKMTGFEAEKSDPLGQTATFGYKMWTGAKVIDPLAIVQVYSVSNFDVSSVDIDPAAVYGAAGTDVLGAAATQA